MRRPRRHAAGRARVRPRARRREPRAGSAPTTSTSTCCTSPTRDADRRDARGVRRARRRRARCARSAARTSPPRSSTRPRRRRRSCGVPAFVNVAERLQPPAPRVSRPRCSRRASASASRFMPYFPLASGVLTGKYKRGEAPPEGTRLRAWGDRGRRTSRPTSVRRGRAAGRVRRRARPHPPRARAVVAGGQARPSPV